MVTNARPLHSAPFAIPLADLLRELAGVVGQLTAAQYNAPAGESFFRGTIGGHVRHCLDHARALLDTIDSGVIDYDARDRGTRIELDPGAARDEIHRLRTLAESAAQKSPDLTVFVRVLPTRDGAPVQIRSTLGRELGFVLSHTIHHNAMIRGMAMAMGIGLPQSFGYAPSTLAHQTMCQSRAASGECACAH